jgi:HSP20 family protein
MAITLWRTRTPFEGLLRWFDDDFFETDFEKSWRPALDFEEKNGEFLVKADLPGLKKEDIHIELKNHTLTLSGERCTEHEEARDRYHRFERTFGTFARSFTVPEGVTENDIHAKYTDGVLELTIPVPKAEEPKAIEVKVE